MNVNYTCLMDNSKPQCLDCLPIPEMLEEMRNNKILCKIEMNNKE